MDFKYYLYQHIREDLDSVFYIGIGTKAKKHTNAHNKEYSRAYSKGSRNNFWHNVVSHTDYKVEILMESDDYEIVKKVEIALIKQYGRRDLGEGNLVNLTDGGDGSINVIISDKTRLKLGKQNLGVPRTEEVKSKIREAKKGIPWTEEFRQNYMKNSKEHAENKENAILILNLETGIYYGTISQGARSYGISSTHLSCMLSGNGRNNTPFVYAESKEGSCYPIIPEIKPYQPFIVADEYRKNLSNKLKGVHSGSKNGQAKKVINILTGKIYLCAKDACEDSEYNYPYFTQMISSKTKTRNKTPFEYYDPEKHAHLLNK